MLAVDLRLDRVSKAYRIRTPKPAVKKSLGSAVSRTATEDFWAVRDISFDVGRGEALGLIGHNGAGKSTILKLLSSITSPTEGEITINGRLSALLEVGSGFHPDLTGRENTFLSGSILGMRRKEIAAKLDSIIEFAGVRQFLDVPVKQYSSGMTVRLGFSIAAHLNPDILLLDEVLAVGDRSFQQKCQDRIGELHRQGTTLIFISHDLTAIKNVCQRVILMQRGEIIRDGRPDEVIKEYTESASFHQRSRTPGEHRVAEIVDVAFYISGNTRSGTFQTGDSVTVRVDYIAHKQITKASVSLFFYASDSTLVTQWTTAWRGPLFTMKEGFGTVEFACEELGLQPGVYQIDATVEGGEAREELEWQNGCTSINVEASNHLRGLVYMPHRWHHASYD
jgi:ABC-type polysaccharide/polyol phosphate transport system ATPase subunit